MPLDLPPEVLANMGIGQGAPLPPSDGSAAIPNQFGGMHPDVQAQLGAQLGWTPQGQPMQAAFPPTPTQLPSAGDQTVAPGGGPPDFNVPASSFGAHGKPVAPGGAPLQAHVAPQRPQTFDQRLAGLQQREQDTEQAGLNAIGQGVEAQKGLHADQLSAYQANQSTLEANSAQRKQLQDDRNKAFATNTAQVDANRKAVENDVYNPNKFMDQMGVGDHIRWGIGQILAGIGQGMQRQGGPNPVTQMLQDKIHEANVGQRENHDRLVAKLGMSKDARQDATVFSTNKLADIDHSDALSLTRLAKDLDQASIKSGDPIAAANGAKAAADLRGAADDKFKSAIQIKSEHDLQQQGQAIAGGHLALAQRAENRAQKLQDLEYGPGGFKEQELGIKAADEMRKMNQVKKDKVATEGVYDPTTGNGLLTEAGKGMVAQADQLEATARKDPAAAASAYVQHLRSQVTTPQAKAQVDQLDAQIKSDPNTAQQVANGYVAQLRDTAHTQEVATIPDKEVRAKVQEVINHGQNIYGLASKIKAFIANDPGITDREGWGNLQAQWGSMIGQEAKFLGSNASSREFAAISQHILDYDPSSIVDRAARKTPAIGQLDGLMQATKSAVNTELLGHGIKDGWTPRDPVDSPAPKFGGQTAQEVGAGEEPGGATKAFMRFTHPLGGTDQAIQQSQSAAENASPSGLTGLAPADETRALSMIKRADAAPNAERAQIAQNLASPIIGGERPALAAGLLRLVHAQDPALYREVLSKLPPIQAQEIDQYITPGAAPAASMNLTPEEIAAARAGQAKAQ